MSNTDEVEKAEDGCCMCPERLTYKHGRQLAYGCYGMEMRHIHDPCDNVTTLENSCRPTRMDRCGGSSGSPEGSFLLTGTDGRCTEGRMKKKGRRAINEEGCTSKDAIRIAYTGFKRGKNVEGCTSNYTRHVPFRRVHDDATLERLSRVLRIFICYSAFVSQLCLIFRTAIYIAGKLTFLWGDQLSGGISTSDYGWQIARLGVVSIATIVKIVYEDTQKTATRTTVGRHHHFHRSRRSPTTGKKVALLFAVLLSNQNLIAAAQVSNAAGRYDGGHRNHLSPLGGIPTLLVHLGTMTTTIQEAVGSFTDHFLQRTWLLTTRGEQDIAGVVDLVHLRQRWDDVGQRFGVPRPIDFATLRILRPPGPQGMIRGTNVDIARFDDLDTIVATIAGQWTDTQNLQWRLIPINEAYRQTRTGDPSWFPYLLLTGDELAEGILIPGLVDISARNSEFEHSIDYTGWLPRETTWAEFSHWSQFDDALDGTLETFVTINGVHHLHQHVPLGLTPGFFLQIIATAPEEGNYAGLPRRFCQRWPNLFARQPNYNVEQVFVVSTDRPFAMDYIHSVERESEVARRWPWLRRGDIYPIHPSAIFRVPPWNTGTPPAITQHYHMVGQVAILGRVQDGISSRDIAFVARVRSTIIELHGHLQCQQRCLAPGIECITRHNSRLCYYGQVLDLQNGDYVEVTVATPTEQPTGDFRIVTRTDDMSRNATVELRSDRSDPAIQPSPIDLPIPGIESTVSLSQSLLQTNIILTKTNRTTSSVGCNPRRSPRGDLRSIGGVRTANAQLTKELDTHSRNDQWSTHSHVNHTSEHGCRHDIVRRPGQDEEALLGGSRNGQGTIRLYTRSQDIFRQPVCRSDIHPVWDVDAIFYRLQPPGNGAIHNLTDDGQEKDFSNTTNTRQIIDVRNRITLDALDDFHITSQHIVICEATSRKRSVVQLSDPGITDELLHSLMQEWPEDVIDPTFQKIADLHPLAQQYVDGARCFHWDEVEEIHIYCDGSTHFCQETNTQHAGCSIVITATTVSPDGPGYSLLGFTGGTICTDPTSDHWWGAESTQAIEAERTGVLLSLLWILQSPFACGLPCTVVFDCMAAGYGAEGTWNYPSDSTLAEMLRGISQLVTEYLPGLVKYLHTHAHVGDPANELADCLAKSFAKGELPNYLAFLDLEWLVRATHNHGSWIWLYFGSFARVEDLPFIAENQVYLPDNKRCDRVPPNSSLEAHETEGQAKIVTLTFATINVKSLYAGDVNKQDGGSYMPMKAQYLAQQLDWYQYDIVGIQESNSRHTGISQVGSFVRLMGGCTDKGQLGCEIWLNRDRLKFQLHEICVLHTDHRRIFIRVQNNILDFIVGSIHSPHSGTAEDERTGWWNKTQDLCKRYSVMAHLVILADANAQVTQPMDNLDGQAWL